MSAYSRGADRERKVCELFRRRGFFVIRAAGSHGPADLVALRTGEAPVLCQVKTSYKRPSKNEIAALERAALISGGKGLLCLWPPRKSPRWIYSADLV